MTIMFLFGLGCIFAGLIYGLGLFISCRDQTRFHMTPPPPPPSHYRNYKIVEGEVIKESDDQ